MKAQYGSGAGDHGDRTLLDDTSSAPLSLKARETDSLSLKRIFEQQLQQKRRSLNFTVHSSSAITNDSDINGDSHDCQAAIEPAAAAADQPDLDLKLAPLSTSYTMVNNLHIADRNVGSGPLTMFYAGTVRVYEDIPAAKAQAILLLASGISGADSYRASCTNKSAHIIIKSRPETPSLVLPTQNIAETAAAAHAPTSSRPAKACRRSQAELPFARKASLTRFLERRKERVEEKAVVANKGTSSSIEPPPKRPCLASLLDQS